MPGAKTALPPTSSAANPSSLFFLYCSCLLICFLPGSKSCRHVDTNTQWLWLNKMWRNRRRRLWLWVVDYVWRDSSEELDSSQRSYSIWSRHCRYVSTAFLVRLKLIAYIDGHGVNVLFFCSWFKPMTRFTFTVINGFWTQRRHRCSFSFLNFLSPSCSFWEHIQSDSSKYL